MRIVIAEDSAILRAGLERLLVDAGHEVIAAVADANELLATVHNTPPDLAIIDVRMPPMFTDEGIRAAVLIRKQNPDVKVLVFSQYVEEQYASELIAENTGGFGYLLKDRVADVEDFLAAVDEVASGGTVLRPRSRLADPRAHTQEGRTVHTQPARTRSPPAHGRRQIECRDRPHPLPQCGSG